MFNIILKSMWEGYFGMWRNYFEMWQDCFDMWQSFYETWQGYFDMWQIEVSTMKWSSKVPMGNQLNYNLVD